MSSTYHVAETTADIPLATDTPHQQTSQFSNSPIPIGGSRNFKRGVPNQLNGCGHKILH